MTVLLGVVGGVTVCILLINLAEIYHAQWYIPLQLKSSALDRWLALAAFIHLWSALISYDTEPEFHSIRIFHCSLWSYWLQIFFGLQPWVLLMIFRALQHGKDFHPKLKRWGHRRHFLVKVGLVLISGIPLLAVCIFVPITLDAEEKCHAPVVWKVPIMIWSTVSLVVLSMIGIEVYRKSPVVTRSGKALRDCVIAALVILLSVSAIHIIGFEEDGLAVVPLIAFLHFFVFVRCFAYTIWKAMTRDFEYANSFFTKVGESKNIEHRTMLTVDLDREAMADFINFANMKGRNDLVQLYEDSRDILLAKRKCLDSSEMWVNMTEKHELALGAVLGMDADFVDKISPERLYSYILCHMQGVLGKEYLASEWHRPKESIFDRTKQMLDTPSGTDDEKPHREKLTDYELGADLDYSSSSISSLFVSDHSGEDFEPVELE